MLMKKLAALVAASSLSMAPLPALAQPVPAAEQVASMEGESELMDSGILGFLIVFGAGMAVGALLYSVLKGGDDEEPVSP